MKLLLIKIQLIIIAAGVGLYNYYKDNRQF
jgi:hypothetical protein